MPAQYLLRIPTAILKAQLRRFLGDETLEALSEELTDQVREDLVQRLDAFLNAPDRLAALEKALERADACFAHRATDPALRGYVHDLPLRELPSLVEALAALPADDLEEGSLRDVLARVIRRDWTGLSPEQAQAGADLYLVCLRQALLDVEAEGLRTIGRAVLRSEERIARLETALGAWAAGERRRLNVEGDVFQSVLVAGDRNTINYFVGYARALPTDYSSRVRRFLEDYLGVPGGPTPFGGREVNLRDLSGWLEDPTAPPYLLLTAPAGRGKSALLARWSAALGAREDLHVVFVPVSIRYQTNQAAVTFALLAGALARVHGEEPPPPTRRLKCGAAWPRTTCGVLLLKAGACSWCWTAWTRPPAGHLVPISFLAARRRVCGWWSAPGRRPPIPRPRPGAANWAGRIRAWPATSPCSPWTEPVWPTCSSKWACPWTNWATGWTLWPNSTA